MEWIRYTRIVDVDCRYIMIVFICFSPSVFILSFISGAEFDFHRIEYCPQIEDRHWRRSKRWMAIVRWLRLLHRRFFLFCLLKKN